MWTALTFVAACAAPALQDAAPVEPRDVASQVRRAALFKNGLAFVRREVAAPAGPAELRLVDLPPPVHGTFWIAADARRARVGEAIARADERSELLPAGTIPELLRANLGRSVSLHLSDGTSLAGVLSAMPTPDLGPLDAAIVPGTRYGYVPPRPQPLELVFVDDGETTTLLAAADVRRLSAASDTLVRSFEHRTPAASLTLDCEGLVDGATVELAYLTRGLTWAPSYVVDLAGPERARLSAKAVVVNESEDLVGATLEFVTGYPNLQFGSVVDPLAMRGDLEAFFAALGQEPQQQAMVMRQSVMSNFAGPGSGGPAAFPDYGAPGQGTAVEDLFFYERRDVTLARGERALYGLFTLEVPYRHVYQWSIPDTIDDDAQRRGQPQEPREEEVWHSLRLENPSGTPWTTAPAMTTRDGRLLGQDTLHYTAAGSSSTLRITRAADVAAERAEYETGRERGKETFYGSRYDLVRVEGLLRVTNHRADAITLEVTKRLQGELTDNPDEAAVETVAEGLRRVNPNQHLTWTRELAGGATVELRYAYSLYVRS